MVERSVGEMKPSTWLTEVNDIPHFSQVILSRPALTESLSRGIHKRIISITAPAGYGKTALVCEWIKTGRIEHQVGWVNLSASILREEKFWCYLILGVRRPIPDFELHTDEFLEVFRNASAVDAVNLFLNRLKICPGELFLVLDNFHLISTAPFLEHVLHFIDHLPANVHLILLGRTIPAIRFSRLLAQQELIQVTPEDLTLTLAETKQFLLENLKGDLDPDQIQKIYQLSEGWMAGVLFLFNSLSETKNKILPESDDAWVTQSLKDFIEEEILSSVTANQRELINTICCLSEITSPICDSILEQKDSGKELAILSKEIPFLKRCAEDDNRYQLHRLFSLTIRNMFQDNDPDKYREVIEKAAHWSEQHGQLIHAIEYDLELEKFEKAAEILNDYIMKAIMNYDQFGLIEIMENLPDQILMEQPNTGIYYAMAFFLAKRINEIEPVLHLVEEVLNTDRQNRFTEEQKKLFRWKINVVRLTKSFRYESVIDPNLLKEVLKDVPEEDAYLFGIMNHTQAEYHLQRLEFTRAADAFLRGVEFAGKHQILHGHVFSLCGLARIYKEQGRLTEAEWHYGRALKLLRGIPGYIGAHDLIQSGLVEIHLLRKEMDEARRLMQEIVLHLDDVESNLNFWYESLLHYLRVGTYQIAMRNIKEAHKSLDLATTLWQKNSSSTVVMPPELIALKMQIWIDLDRIEEGKTWFTHRIRFLENLNRPTFAELIAYSQLLLASAEPQKALDILTKAEEEANRYGFALLANQIPILKSIGYLFLEKTALSTNEMESAIKGFMAEQIIEPFMNKGLAVYKILKALHEENLTSTGKLFGDSESLFLDRIILNFEQNKRTSDVELKKMAGSIQLVNGELSNRELEILSLLVREKTIKEISSILMISINTTKSHLKSIYRKFGEHKNKDVIRKALEFGLVQQ